MHSPIARLSRRIIDRSKSRRTVYLARIDKPANEGPQRHALICGKLVHGIAEAIGKRAAVVARLGT